MKAGASCEAHYAVPPDAWYFDANRCEMMPFSVLLEIALQPCGWLAAYCGSALTSPDDLSFRNLGGKATQFRAVTPDSGTLTTNVKMTNVSSSAGMIIQHYEMRMSDVAGPVYEGTTYFGFFSKSALANQVGIRDAKVPWPTDAERARAENGILPHESPFPAPMLRMIDRIDAFIPDGGKHGLGLIVGKIAVDPAFWFFQAHFYQDPVWPGSLGLESFLQLLKFVAWKRWGESAESPPTRNAARSDLPLKGGGHFRTSPGCESGASRPPRPPEGEVAASEAPRRVGGKTAFTAGYQAVSLNRPHSWVYRGQVLPSDHEVTVVLEVTEADDRNESLTANGFLVVDGRVIYQMADFTLE